MNYEGLVRKLDPAHEQYVAGILEAFRVYREFLAANYADRNNAIIGNDAEKVRLYESATDKFNAAVAGIDDEAEPIVVTAKAEYDAEIMRVDKVHADSKAAIERSYSASDARAYEWFNSRANEVRTQFNLWLIDAIQEFAA